MIELAETDAGGSSKVRWSGARGVAACRRVLIGLDADSPRSAILRALLDHLEACVMVLDARGRDGWVGVRRQVNSFHARDPDSEVR